MAERKTQYMIPISTDSQKVNNVVVNWLNTSGFKFMEKDGHQYYVRKSALSGNRFFEFYFEDNNLIVLAYIRSLKRPMPLDNGFVGSLGTTPYMEMISSLIATIDNLQSDTGADQQAPTKLNDTCSKLATEIQSRYKKLSALACGLSICDFILGFFGLSFGLLFIILTYYLAIKCLKSSNKVPSIIALVLTTIATLVFIINVMYALALTNAGY